MTTEDRLKRLEIQVRRMRWVIIVLLMIGAGAVIFSVTRREDIPGIIGTVGTTFGRHNVNIAQMAVGRSGARPGGAAIGVLNLDQIPPQEAIDAVLEQPAIHSVTVIQLPAAGEGPAWLQG